QNDELTEAPAPEPHPVLPMVAIGALLGAIVLVTVFAGPINRYLNATAAQLFAPEPYIATVLDTPGKVITYTGKDDHGDKDSDKDADHNAEDH
ncbi:MAG: monovalent cation/H+ antiporter subunit D, partial [Pseudomonadota bacterium]